MFTTASFIVGMFGMQVVLTAYTAYLAPMRERLEVIGRLSLVAAGLWAIEMIVTVAHNASTHTYQWAPMYAAGMAIASFFVALGIACLQTNLKIGNAPTSTRR